MKFFESFLFITIAAASVFFTTAFACESEVDCLPTEQCSNIGTGCYDPCEGIHDRYLNGQCVVRDHILMFDCIEGFQQREYGWGCERIPHKCQSHNDCFPEQLCKDGDCFEPCYAFHDSVSNCTVINHEVKLECPEGYITLPNVWGCIDKHSFICQSNDECWPHQQCKDGDCFDLCSEFNDSVTGNCTVVNHEQIVVCPEGYETRPNALGCVDKTLAYCQSHENCPPEQLCRNGDCFDPCLEFEDETVMGTCAVINHDLRVECPEGSETRHNILGCIPKTSAGCEVDGDCWSYLKCNNSECFDPCIGFDETVIGYCNVINHEQIVTCPEGYETGPDVDTIVGCVAKGQRE